MGILDNKAGVVTGSGRGIGRGHCLALAANGGAVVVNDVELDEAEKVVKEITDAGGRAIANGSDIGTRKGCEDLVEACVAEFGGIHYAVNNAGVVRDKTLLKMTDEDFDLVMKVHVYGTFWLTQAAALRMAQQKSGGAIVNTISGALFGNFGQTNYAGAKGAIASMTFTWALELARYGIRVNAIGPQGTTRMSDTYKGPGGEIMKLPFIDPNLNGPTVAFLCSDEADYVSGQCFGTGNNRIALVDQPAYGKTMIQEGGWDIDAILKNFKNNIGNSFGPLGLTKIPYPFYDGIKPKAD